MYKSSLKAGRRFHATHMCKWKTNLYAKIVFFRRQLAGKQGSEEIVLGNAL